MPRLSAMQGAVSLVLVVSVGSWWLASLALGIGGRLDDVTGLAAQAAVVLLIAQWLAIALFASHVSKNASTNWQSVMASLLSVTVPLWPFLAILWLSSRLSLAVLIGSQLGAVALAGSLGLAARLAARTTPNAELGNLFRVATGLAMAGMIWIARSSLAGWVLP